MMKTLAALWKQLPESEQQTYKDEAPLMEVKEKKAPKAKAAKKESGEKKEPAEKRCAKRR